MSDFVILHGTRLRFAFRMPVDGARAEECVGYCRPLSPCGQLWDWDWVYVDGRHFAQFRFETRDQCEIFAAGVWVNLSGFQAGSQEDEDGANPTLRASNKTIVR